MRKGVSRAEDCGRVPDSGRGRDVGPSTYEARGSHPYRSGDPATQDFFLAAIEERTRVTARTDCTAMFGDAVDINVNDRSNTDEYWTMVAAGWAAGADYGEPPNLACHTDCAHSDWRDHSGGCH